MPKTIQGLRRRALACHIWPIPAERMDIEPSVIVLFLASQINREQQRAIEYLQVENQVPREKLG